MSVNDQFLNGVCSALAVVAHLDDEIVWWEIVNRIGEDRLLAHATRFGTRQWSGFTKYLTGNGHQATSNRRAS